MRKFFLGDLSQICLPTHPRVLVRFGRTKGEIWVKKAGWFGEVLDFVWESATPSNHIWEKSPRKKVFFGRLPFIKCYRSHVWEITVIIPGGGVGIVKTFLQIYLIFQNAPHLKSAPLQICPCPRRFWSGLHRAPGGRGGENHHHHHQYDGHRQCHHHHHQGGKTRHNLHWSCRSRSSSACKVIFNSFIIDIINIIVSIIVVTINIIPSVIAATINLYRFLGDVSGLAEFVDDKVTICLCSNLLHLTRTPSSLIVMVMIISASPLWSGLRSKNVTYIQTYSSY